MGEPTPRETGLFRTEGGSVVEMDLPLSEPIAQRVAKGEIVRVANADGDAWVEPEPAPVVDHAAEAAELREQLAAAVDENELQAKELEYLRNVNKTIDDANAELQRHLDEANEKLAAAEAERDELLAAAPPAAPEPAKTPAKKAAAKADA